MDSAVNFVYETDRNNLNFMVFSLCESDSRGKGFQRL